MKVALAHDSFTQMGGAERIAAALHDMYQDAPVYTLVVDEKLRSELAGWKLQTSWLQKIYNLYPRFQHLFPLIPLVLETTPPISADLLISSSSSYAKGYKKSPGTVHINYCHTPTRFLWVDPKHAFLEMAPLLRPVAKAYFWFLKRWDYRAAQNIDYFIVNSQEVHRRVQEYYRRDAAIVYPFVDGEFWHPTKDKQGYFLVAGRLQRAKNLEVAIRTCNELKMNLHVVGTGRYENYLRSIAGHTIKFLGRLDDAGLRDEYSGAQALLYPQMEDFGIMPLEAAACGTATIGLARGGSLETVIPGQTGELLPEITQAALALAIKNWDISKYKAETLRTHAAQFSKEIFQTKIKTFLENILRQRDPLT